MKSYKLCIYKDNELLTDCVCDILSLDSKIQKILGDPEITIGIINLMTNLKLKDNQTFDTHYGKVKIEITPLGEVNENTPMLYSFLAKQCDSMYNTSTHRCTTDEIKVFQESIDTVNSKFGSSFNSQQIIEQLKKGEKVELDDKNSGTKITACRKSINF